MLSPTSLSVAISLVLGTEPLPVLNHPSPKRPISLPRIVTCDCCGSSYLLQSHP